MSNTGTQWHTYGIRWTPDSITYTIDGRQWAVVQASQVSSPGSWPDIPMNLDLQSQNLGTDAAGRLDRNHDGCLGRRVRARLLSSGERLIPTGRVHACAATSPKEIIPVGRCWTGPPSGKIFG